MKSIAVTIRGVSPLLMHAYPMVEIEGLSKMEPREQAGHHLYLDPATGKPYLPGTNIQRGIVAAAAYSKGKGRASLQKIAAATMIVREAACPLTPSDWVVDSRAVVIPATKGRIIRHRARFDDWQSRFTLDYDETLVNNAQARRVVDDLGQRVGLLDFRPEKKGPFGRFMVTGWDAD